MDLNEIARLLAEIVSQNKEVIRLLGRLSVSENAKMLDAMQAHTQQEQSYLAAGGNPALIPYWQTPFSG